MTIHREALRTDVQGLPKSMILQQASLVKHRTSLLKQVQQFHELQCLHMVGFKHRSYEDMPSLDNVEDVKLYLPSSLLLHTRHQYCQTNLLQMEEHIQDAEAHDSLEDLHHHLHTWSQANKWKVANVTGQIHNTQAWERQAHIDDHVCASASRYRKAQAALLQLQGHGDWEEEL